MLAEEPQPNSYCSGDRCWSMGGAWSASRTPPETRPRRACHRRCPRMMRLANPHNLRHCFPPHRTISSYDWSVRCPDRTLASSPSFIIQALTRISARPDASNRVRQRWHVLRMSTSPEGWLIQARVGSFGGTGRRWPIGRRSSLLRRHALMKPIWCYSSGFVGCWGPSSEAHGLARGVRLKKGLTVFVSTVLSGSD